MDMYHSIAAIAILLAIVVATAVPIDPDRIRRRVSKRKADDAPAPHAE